MNRRQLQFLSIAVIGIIVVMAASLYFIDPDKTNILPRCAFHYLTGLYCPGCGTTRAMHQLLHGNFLAALRFNPLMVISLPFLVLFTVRPSACRKPWVTWLVFTIVIAFWIARNLPWQPFILLAPHGVS